ncbi:TerD family protein [Streptomyces narbonensis]|uniref:TerD family protein n=1 Tax=Streptomyces narbonensis TaxID=67333 RepID=UPI00167811F1|nr:TerD family protein [Streptomyces narbonensis]GGW12290.1 resistance protein [Streptomyces narbonensis]
MLRGLIKGDNAYVPTAALRLAVRSGVDVAALLVTEQGRVRGDADIVFDGAPAHPSGSVRLTEGEDGTVWLDTDLTGVEGEIPRVLVVASTEEGALRDVRGLSVEVFGPDGTTVVGYEVTDAGGETAMVLAELYRRAGGWKFRAVGQGYLDGLVGLAADHGVVGEETPTEDSPTVDSPETETETEMQAPEAPQVAEAPSAPASMPAPAEIQATSPQAPASLPYASPAPYSYPPGTQGPAEWTFGAVFEPHVLTGTGNEVINVDGVPPGPVVVELAVETDGHTSVWTLDARNKDEDLLVNSTEVNFRGRLLVVVPENGRLRLKLGAKGPWQVVVLPLAAARLLTEDTLECWGPNVLLHTGGTTDVAFHYRGSSNFIVDSYDLAGRDDHTTLPDYRWPHINEIGRRRESLPLPEGPVLVHVKRADGPWRARLKQPSAATAWLRRARR